MSFCSESLIPEIKEQKKKKLETIFAKNAKQNMLFHYHLPMDLSKLHNFNHVQTIRKITEIGI